MAAEGVTPSLDLRDRLVLALDVDDLVAATRLVRELKGWFGVAKIGLELFSAAGPDAVFAVMEEDCRVLLDLKLHDIPTTVGRSARVLGALGASFLTMHGAGGVAMLRAGVEGLAEGAAGAGLSPAVALAVTALTSGQEVAPGLVGERARWALEAGCGGVVCAAGDVRQVKEIGPALLAAVPGIRLEGGDRHDQARSATPAAALEAGADLLVIGRLVTEAADRPAAAAALVASLS
jgi:orotidine-5'-phosphate decarboxylase